MQPHETQQSYSLEEYFALDAATVDVKHELLNPMLVVEALSDSARNYDGGKKLGYYIANPDITDILLVDYEFVSITHFRRAAQPQAIGGDWILRTYQSLETNLLIASLELEIAISEIYRDVDFTQTARE